MTDERWTPPIDALVMSVGRSLGNLAAAVDAAFPSARLLDSGYENATPDAPVLRELRAQSAPFGTGCTSPSCGSPPIWISMAWPYTSAGRRMCAVSPRSATVI